MGSRKSKIISSVVVLLAITTATFFSKPKSSAMTEISQGQNAYPEDFISIIMNISRLSKDSNHIQIINLFNDDLFNFHRNSFPQDKISELRIIDSLINETKTHVARYRRLQNEINSQKVKFDSCTQPQDIEKYINDFASLRNTIRSTGLDLKNASSSQYADFLAGFILGIDSIPDSGLVGSMDQNYNSLINRSRDSIMKICANECKIIEEAFKKENIFSNTQMTSRAENSIAVIRDKVSDLQTMNNYFSKLKFDTKKNKYIKSESSVSLSSVYVLCTESKNLFRAIRGVQTEINRKIADGEKTAEGIRANKENYSAPLLASARNYSTYEKIADQAKKSDSIYTLRSFPTDQLSWSMLRIPYINACDLIRDHASTSSTGIWVSLAAYYATAAQTLYEDDFQANENLKKYLAGEDGNYYPSKCMKETEILRANINKDKSILAEASAVLNEGYIYKAKFLNQQKQINECSVKISELEKNFIEFAKQAREQMMESQVAENEINVFYNRSRSYYSRGDYSSAYENWQRANDTYTSVLEKLKKDADIQSQVFEKLQKLRHDIIEGQKPLFVNETRGMKNNARNEYYAGNFTQATSILARIDKKRDDWAKLMDITLEPDAELERLKDYVNTAIAIREGREISAYDSKAPEMRQNLSIAKKYYQEGEKLSSKGKKKESEKLLNEAKLKINQVKIYYPRNKDASSLGLRIDKLLDPKTFSAAFDSKFSQLKQVNYSSRSAMAQESYSTLLDLYEMNPSYPGLKNLLASAEIDLGLKPKPMTKVSTAGATKLANEAQQILNSAGRDTILLQQAKNKANQALEINPNNEKAIMVLDEIALRTGQQSAVTLSAKDEQLYHSALADLQNNKIIEANAKLTRLLANSANTRSAKILKLKKRIEAQL